MDWTKIEAKLGELENLGVKQTPSKGNLNIKIRINTPSSARNSDMN